MTDQQGNRENELDGLDELDWEARAALDDPDGPQECDLLQGDDEEADTVPCPNCGQEIIEDADRCPYCGEWVIQGGGASGRGLAFTLVAILVLIALAYYLL